MTYLNCLFEFILRQKRTKRTISRHHAPDVIERHYQRYSPLLCRPRCDSLLLSIQSVVYSGTLLIRSRVSPLAMTRPRKRTRTLKSYDPWRPPHVEGTRFSRERYYLLQDPLQASGRHLLSCWGLLLGCKLMFSFPRAQINANEINKQINSSWMFALRRLITG